MAARESIDVADITRRFERICVAHPNLKMVLDTDPGQADLAMTIPVQDGASFPLRMNLQGDELHLMAGEHFWVEWFPVDDPEITDQFFDAVDGLLTGRYRVVEYFRGRRAVKAELQVPDDGDWKVLGKWATLRLPFARMTRNVLINRTLDTTPSPRDTPA